MFGEFQLGSVGPDDEEEPSISFIPQQKSPEETLKDKVKLTTEVGLRKVTSIIDVMEDDEQLSFVLEELLPDTGLLIVAGSSGTGKTILATQITGNIVLGQPAMTWRTGKAWRADFKALFLSLEMPKKELQLRLQHMYPNLTEDDRKEFMDRFLSYHDPEPFELWNPVHVLDLTRLIKHHNINLLLIDSASVSYATSMKNDEQVNESIKNLYMLRSRLNLAMIVVCHTRKPTMEMINNPEMATLHELMGHSGFAQSASSVVIMAEDEAERKKTVKSSKPENIEKVVHIVNAKSRFGTNSGAFKSHLTSKSAVDKGEPLMFRRNAIPIEMTEEQRTQINKKLQNMNPMDGIDFGSAMDGDE